MNKLSAKHFLLFVLGVTFISYKTYTSLFIELGGRDTWLCFILAFIIFISFVAFITSSIDYRTPCDLNYVFTTGLSKSIGNIFLFLFSIGLFLSALEATSVEVNAMKVAFFNETPTWYIMFFFLLPSVFLLNKKFETLLNFIIISVAFIIANSFIFMLIVEKYKNIDYILPVLGPGLTPSFFYCAIIILGSLSSFAITLPYIKYITSHSKIKKHTLIAIIIIGAICLYSTIGLISTFGPLRAANIFYPEHTQGQRVQISGFLDFGELFFLFQTVIGFFIKYIISSYGLFIIYEKYISNKKYAIIFYTLIVFILSNFIGCSNFILFTLLDYYQIINLVVFIIIPFISILAFNFRLKKK